MAIAGALGALAGPRPAAVGTVASTLPTRPNILVIVTDDQRAEGTLEVMAKTRRWFQGGGTTYRNGFATTPLCCPSRSTIFSGRYMHNHGVLTNDDAGRLDHRFTLQRYLGDAGYQTAMAGKFLVSWDTDKAPPYFDHFALTAGGYIDAAFNVDGAWRRVPYSTDFVADKTVDFLEGFEKRDASPWLLYLAPQAPHGDFTPSPRYANAAVGKWRPGPGVFETEKRDKAPFLRPMSRSLASSEMERRQQLRTLLSVDDLVDRVMRRLEKLGEADNTLAFFTSDNGYFWGEHGLNSKGLPYTESVKVPFLVRWPVRLRASVTSQRLVAGIDILPTVLDAAGVAPRTVGRPLDGRSLLAPGSRRRLLLEFHRGHRRYPSWASLRTESWQYLEYYEEDDTTVSFAEYYDLVEDPYQLENLLGTREGSHGGGPDIDELSAELARHRRCQGRSGPSACP